MYRIDHAKYPETTFSVKELFPLLRAIPNKPLELLWEEFSTENYMAGHMRFSTELAREFYDWLFERIDLNENESHNKRRCGAI